MLHSAPVRWVRSRLGATYHHTMLARHPRVLCNSIPKSGTNLLIELVNQLPWLRNHRRGVTWHHVPRALVDEEARATLESVRQELGVCLPGEVYLGHVEADPEVMALIRDRFTTLFVYRDPRDVVVSLLHWWNRDPSSTWSEPDSWPFRYFHALGSDGERLSFLIGGWPSDPGPGFPSDVDFPDVGTRVAAFAGWVDEPSCLPVRFEELRGGGAEVLRPIARHLYPRASDTRVERLVVAMGAGSDPTRSSTFRRGGSGGWRDEFGPEHIESMKRHAGQVLIDLGYESDLEW